MAPSPQVPPGSSPASQSSVVNSPLEGVRDGQADDDDSETDKPDPRTILLGMDGAADDDEIGFIIAALTPERPDLAGYLLGQAAKDEGRSLIAWARRQLARTRGPRRAPPCPDCGTPYTADQLADDEFRAKAMAGTAGCVHPEDP